VARGVPRHEFVHSADIGNAGRLKTFVSAAAAVYSVLSLQASTSLRTRWARTEPRSSAWRAAASLPMFLWSVRTT